MLGIKKNLIQRWVSRVPCRYIGKGLNTQHGKTGLSKHAIPLFQGKTRR